MANDTPTTPQEDSPVESPTEIPPFMGSLVRDEEGEVVGLEEGTSLQPYRRVGITEKFLDPETGEMVGFALGHQPQAMSSSAGTLATTYTQVAALV